MSKFPLDLSKFKKSGSDGATTTLKHPDGHQITIAHAALDKTKLQALSKLPLLTQEANLPPTSMAEAGTVKEPSPRPQESAEETKLISDMTQPQPQIETESTPAEDTSEDSDGVSEEGDSAVTMGSDAPAVAVAPQPQEESFPPPEEDLPPPEAESAPAAPPPDQAPNQPVTPQHIGQAMGKDPVQNQQAILNEQSQVQQDMAAGHIKPETYKSLFEDKGTLGKISSIFGLLLGGAGGGLTHQQNPLTAMWDRQISNDLEAQKTNMANKTNLLSSLQQQFGDVQSGSDMARLYLDRAAFQNLVDQGKDLPPGSPAAQQYQSGLGMVSQFLDTRAASASQKIAMKQALVNTLKEQPGGSETAYQNQQGMLRRGNEMQQKLADENDKHHVPGFNGQASVPVPEDTRNRLQALQQYDQKAQEYVQFAKRHAYNWANLSPVDRARVANQGAAMGANLQSLYRNKIKGGVYKKGEQEFIEQIIPDQPASWSSSFKAIPKVVQTIGDNRDDMANTAAAYGLSMPRSMAPQPQQAPGAGPQMKLNNGIWYKRGANGEAVPVQ